MTALSSTGWRGAVTPVTIKTPSDRSLLRLSAPVASLTSARTSRMIRLWHNIRYCDVVRFHGTQCCESVICDALFGYAMLWHGLPMFAMMCGVM
eukprot:1511522-Pyramimonas_sp.AAC.1